MILTDSHCHLDFDRFDPDRDRVIRNAAAKGVQRIVIPGTESHRWPKLHALASLYPGIFYAVGVHPWFLHDEPADWRQQLAERLEQRPAKLVAVGEIGLDAAVDLPMTQQQDFFQDQLRLAADHGLPVILHARQTHEPILKQLRRFRPPGGVIHSFSGSLQQAEAYIALGFKLGVSGVITYERAAKTRQVMARVPLDALVLETDAPDMPLYGFQGQRNEPERVTNILATLAILRGECEDSIGAATEENVSRLFALPA
ncbi:TatD family hydrolase [Zobellella maritima]|uniref:TatD family hydrolase n=1 Tax=Zobellella maritima TaxID=2059725 RepID=UPI000E30B413|nr:TatD family hydrolase [Zobellella maritima]